MNFFKELIIMEKQTLLEVISVKEFRPLLHPQPLPFFQKSLSSGPFLATEGESLPNTGGRFSQ